VPKEVKLFSFISFKSRKEKLSLEKNLDFIFKSNKAVNGKIIEK
jgi:hypothetical protein